MKVTFVEDHVSVASGNEFYKAGTQADLVRGQELIDSGVAYEGWGNKPESTLDQMSDDELKALAKERGIKSYWLMSRETLIERLSNDNQ